MFRNDLEGCRWFRSGKIPSKGSVNALGEKIDMKIQENSVKKLGKVLRTIEYPKQPLLGPTRPMVFSADFSGSLKEPLRHLRPQNCVPLIQRLIWSIFVDLDRYLSI